MQMPKDGRIGHKDEDGKWVAECMACGGTGRTHTRSYDQPEFEILMAGYEDAQDEIQEMYMEMADKDEYIAAMPIVAFLILCAEIGQRDDEFIYRMKATSVYLDYVMHL